MATKKKKKQTDVEPLTFYVDIPQLEKEEWVNVDSFETRKQAIAYAMKHFGADKNGKVSLVTQA